jgi:hypothetical protein
MWFVRAEDEGKRQGAGGDEGGDVFGDITITGGTVGAIGGRGHRIEQAPAPAGGAPPEPADRSAGAPPAAQGYDLAVVRDLLLDAFTAVDLRRLFEYSKHPELKEVAREFGEGDGVVDMVDKVLAFCRTRDLLPDLLAEVARVRPRPYARYQDRLSGRGV